MKVRQAQKLFKRRHCDGVPYRKGSIVKAFNTMLNKNHDKGLLKVMWIMKNKIHFLDAARNTELAS